ncbi:hypothetical protein D9619_004726 [Psilocybe cf. subviscida]|uniref:DUF6534 domain-containing protein n=1 Tax=Psilocybe cf. subviscida TaxID=2480587 RepID=A0A8H5F867_9AGAR|nr:hypothetical protein D9619_004726 [Psilocybe cf. subviscida]
MSSLDLNNTFGALLLGTIISSILYGFTCVQSWHYFQNYSDGPLVKVSIAALWILESLHSAFSIHAIYYYVILNYMNPGALIKTTWSAAVRPSVILQAELPTNLIPTQAVLIVTCLITAIVHIFYIWRVYVGESQVAARWAVYQQLISEQAKRTSGDIHILELIRFGAGLSVPIIALQLQFFSVFHTVPKIIVPQDMSLSLSTAIDILIAGSLSIYLHTSKSGMSGTDKVINRLVVHAINNGILTSVADVLCLALGTAEGSNLIYLAVYQSIGNLYTNSMLATLNARRSIANGRGPSVELSGMSPSFRIAEPTSIAAQSLTMNGDKSINEDFHETESKDIEINVHKSRITNMA